MEGEGQGCTGWGGSVGAGGRGALPPGMPIPTQHWPAAGPGLQHMPEGSSRLDVQKVLHPHQPRPPYSPPVFAFPLSLSLQGPNPLVSTAASPPTLLSTPEGAANPTISKPHTSSRGFSPSFSTPALLALESLEK